MEKKNQTFLLHFEKKILGMEKKIQTFLLHFKKKIFGKEKKIFKNAQSKLNIDQTFYATFKKKKDGNMLRLHYSKRS